MPPKPVRKPIPVPSPRARQKSKLSKGDKKIRLAVVGAGDRASQIHLPALCSLDQVEIVGLFDYQPELLERASQQFKIPKDRCFTSGGSNACAEKIAEIEPDGVVTSGLPDTLQDLHLWLVANHYNLATDHPVYMSAHQADLLTSMADMNGCITQVALEHRTNPLLNKMLRSCKSHGRIVHAVCEIHDHHPGLDSSAYSRLYGDTLRAVDTLRWICSGEVDDVQSSCQRVETIEINWTGATLYFENGSVGTLINNWVSGRHICRIQIHAYGVCAEIEPESSARLYVEGDLKGVEYDAKRVAGSDEYHVYAGFQAKYREFVEAIRSGKTKTSSSFQEVLPSLDIVESILAESQLNPR
ncbi:MAG TPA: Gfo/Idh/MocA family oxidoreductase [Candidatus Sumerlaeota bacterium]|nr:Gfo/Idh/MocA family oxidoreductase [Candidatus Sumerlaeota bacterium]